MTARRSSERNYPHRRGNAAGDMTNSKGSIWRIALEALSVAVPDLGKASTLGGNENEIDFISLAS
jgi:hypothetical protein